MFRHIHLVNELRLNERFVETRFGGLSPARALIVRSIAFAYHAMSSLFSARDDINAFLAPERRAVFFSSTTNQTMALAPLHARLDGAMWLMQNQRGCGAVAFPMLAAHFLAILLLPYSLAFCVWFAAGRRGARRVVAAAGALCFSLDEILLTPGYLVVAKLWLRSKRPSILVMANDHNTLNRCLCVAAKALAIRTVYVQHAPVSDLFPSFVFDHALLDGRQAEEVYLGIGVEQSKIEILGASRYDGCGARERRFGSGSVRRVSVAFNKIDDMGIVARYIATLYSAGYDVVLRPHPGISASELRGFSLQGHPVDRRGVFRHLEDVDFVVAGNSGILLDAFMMGVCPVYAEDFSAVKDYYGYERHGAVLSCRLETATRTLAEASASTMSSLTAGMSYFNHAIQTNCNDVASMQAGRIRELMT